MRVHANCSLGHKQVSADLIIIADLQAAIYELVAEIFSFERAEKSRETIQEKLG